MLIDYVASWGLSRRNDPVVAGMTWVALMFAAGGVSSYSIQSHAQKSKRGWSSLLRVPDKKLQRNFIELVGVFRATLEIYQT